ncbi:MAG: hypothetical protein HKP30_17465 [Myxococcales bacterium]|nr:hypothetical protein [Myxococcales bacterium]
MSLRRRIGALLPARLRSRIVRGLAQLQQERGGWGERRRLAQVRRRIERDVREGRFGRPYVVASPPDVRQWMRDVDANYREFANPFEYYARFVEALDRIGNQEIVPVRSLLGEAAAGLRRVALRHDIDADPVTAVRAARHLARVGVPGSFYLLHTAPYYGRLEGGVFVRSPDVREWLRSLIVSGCEVGVHNDALSLLLDHGVDGVGALRAEIEWMRSEGARVHGTVGHNSAVVYGAENSEIFVGRKLWDRPTPLLPLESLDEAEMGLHYEGGFMRRRPDVDVERARAFVADRAAADVRSERWMRTLLLDNPCHDWAVDFQFWLVGQDQWVVGGRKGDFEVFESCVAAKRVLELLADLPGDARSLVVLHPEYVRH